MNYPLITEYVEAVRSAAENLDDHDPLLASLRPVVQEGRPFYSSGNYAVVFKMKAPDGRLYAMKCWHKEMPGRDERYDLIAEELDSVQSSYLLGVRYCAEGLFVDSATADGELFPVLLMDWVEGTPLDAYLRTHRHDGYALGMVAYRFGLMAQWLMGQGFAHGDLKPDNILVRPDGTLVLVDYDGMFVPAMRGMAALECGTPNFRHPARTAQQFDDHIDDFTLAHIAAALKAVALQPTLLDTMPQDALLFTDDDFRDLAHSPVLSTLQALLADAEMARLTGLLFIAHAEGGLSQPMQPLFRLARPQKVEVCFRAALGNIDDFRLARSQKVEEVLSTKVTKEDLANAIEDEYGVKYSPDGKRLLKGNDKLNEYQVRPGTKVICDLAFVWCRSLQSITLPDSVTHIGDRAFEWCYSLQSITLPDSVTHIGDSAFSHCYSLQSITLPDSVTHIGSNPFWNSGIKEIINHSVHFKVQDSCLYNADGTHLISYFGNEESVTLPDSVTHIGDSAFWGCGSLQSITLPDSVTHIGSNPFKHSGIKVIISHSVHFKVQDSCLYNADGTHLISYIGDEESVTLPDSVTHIGDHAFYKCEALQSITLPDSVTHIGDSAFCVCESLQSITLPDSVTHIGDRAFLGCRSLRAITLPDSVTHIGNRAFEWCKSLQSITLPDSVTHIGDSAFEYCGSLQRIVVPKGCGEKYRKMLPRYEAKIVDES